MPFVAKRVFDWNPVEITAEWGLRDLRQGMAYSICNSLQCPNCGALFLDIRFTDAEMSSLYYGYRDVEYVTLRDQFEPGYAARNPMLVGGFDYIPRVERFLAPYVKSAPKVLDWGGDTGLNTPFRNVGSAIHIYDISHRPPVSGATHIDKDTIQRTEYDLIVLSNVIEHVPFPDILLADVRDTMTRSTVLYIEVPHEDLIRLGSTPDEVLRAKRHWHEHINFFTSRALNILLERASIEVLAMESMEISVGGKTSHVFMIASKMR